MTDWPVEDYGKFYDGDSYVILNVSPLSLSLSHLADILILIGSLRCLKEAKPMYMILV